MAPNDIRFLLERHPFRPIRIFVSDGSQFEVGLNTLAIVQQTTLILGESAADEVMPLRSIYIDTRHVTRIEASRNTEQ